MKKGSALPLPGCHHTNCSSTVMAFSILRESMALRISTLPQATIPPTSAARMAIIALPGPSFFTGNDGFI